MRNRNYTFFIGTDVSRDTLDHAVMQGNRLLFHQQIPNQPGPIQAFITKLRTIAGFTIAKSLFCMENTGYYCNPLLSQLHKCKARVMVEGAKKIRNTLGDIRGKNDKMDAIRIAEFAYKSREAPRLWEPKRTVLQELARLVTLRDRLIGVQTALKTPLNEQLSFVHQKASSQDNALNNRSIEALAFDIGQIQTMITALLEGDEKLARLMQIITSVPLVGPVTAMHMIICTNEFRNIHDPKKFACYAGVAPFLHDSGKFKGKAKVSHMANKKMKSLLHMCALNARRSEPELRSYYERKTVTENKPKMAVINAIRYKLILRVFACVRQDRLYEKEYVR